MQLPEVIHYRRLAYCNSSYLRKLETYVHVFSPFTLADNELNLLDPIASAKTQGNCYVVENIISACFMTTLK